MSRIVLIRPCSTDFDEQGRIQGTLDIPLNAQGSVSAWQLAADLRPLEISLIYSSPCQAAWQTASAISEALDVKVKKIDSWQNVDHGLWQGMLVDDLRRKHPKVFRQWQEQPECVCPPEGETLRERRTVPARHWKNWSKSKKAAPSPWSCPSRGRHPAQLAGTRRMGDSCKRKSSCGSWELVDWKSRRSIIGGWPQSRKMAACRVRHCR